MAGNENGNDRSLAHVASKKALLGTFGILMILTVVTVVVAKTDLGSANLVVAMVIATIKAALVCLFFMHLRYEKRIYALVFLAALLFATLFVGLTLMDSTQYQDSILWGADAPLDSATP